jgi:hypothetical protein
MSGRFRRVDGGPAKPVFLKLTTSLCAHEDPFYLRQCKSLSG